jgi:serine/threonine-protein kinase PknK
VRSGGDHTGRVPFRRSVPSTSGDGSAPAIGGYSNLAVIGRGATATVYRATQDGFDRQVAVKVINVDVSDRRAQRRFQRERSLNGRLSDHPNVVTVLDSGFVNDRYPYLVTELFDQGSLADRLTRSGPLDLAAALHIGVRIAGALESAHRLGVLHRDVKPHNILLSRFGEPALADFGIAALLEMGHSVTAALTPVHAAPEVLEGVEAGPTADVYSLASTLYTLLAGTPPFAGPAGEGMLSQMLRITTAEVPPMPRPDVPAMVVDCLRAALAKAPGDRPGTAAAFGAMLQQVQADLGLAPTPIPVDAPTLRPVGSGGNPALPAPGAASAGDRSAAGGDLTIDVPRGNDRSEPMPNQRPVERPIEHPIDPGGETVLGRQVPPAAIVEQRSRRRWVVPVVALGALAVGVAATVLVTGALGDDDESVSSSVPSTVAITDPNRFTPGDVVVPVIDGALIVQWADRTNGQRPHVVYMFDETGDEPRSWNVPLGAESQIADGVEQSAPVCFVVRAILEVGPPAVFADSEPTCINGAVFET